MTKKLIYLLLTFSLLAFISCLDPSSLDLPELNVDVSGNISVTDITSAVFLLTNRSKTVDITEVNISYDQGEWTAAPNPKPQRDSVIFMGMPKRTEQKAQYVMPTDISYIITIRFHDSDPKEGQNTDGERILKIAMPIPRNIYEYFVYKDIDGVVQIVGAGDIDRNLPNSDPEDTTKDGSAKPELPIGEGSSPAVIPPEYRNKMGTAIVVNMTNSQAIGEMSFTQGGRTYILGNVSTADKRSIALGQGDWQVNITYNRNNTEYTIGPKNIVIVPSNDPQSIKEHYIYFYLNEKNEYTFVTGNPPTDASDKDIIPPDTGHGSGVIMITNKTSAMVISTTIRNLNDDRVQNYYYEDGFIPQRPIQYGQTGFINVIGTSEFPIQNHNRYLVSVDLESTNGIVTVQTLAYILNSVVHIEINNQDITSKDRTIGVTMHLSNMHKESVITGLVLEDQSGRMLVYSMNSWGNIPVKENGGTATFQVLTTSNVPIHENSYFVAHLTVQYKGSNSEHAGKTAVVSNLQIDPNGNLYGHPASTERSITLNDDDIEWSKISPPVYPPPTSVIPPSVTLRFYGINTVDPITSIILIRDRPGSAGFNENSQDFDDAGSSALPHTTLPIWATGHTKVPFATYFNTTIFPAQITRNNFYDFQRVRDAVRNNSINEITIPGGLAQNKTQYVDITMDLPPEGEGWYVFFLTSLGWVIGHTNPPVNAPNRLQNTLFWVNPNKLITEGYWIDVDNNYYQASSGGNRPKRVRVGDGVRVIPIGHHINDDTTSILKRPSHLQQNGPLVHDAASTTAVNAISN